MYKIVVNTLGIKRVCDEFGFTPKQLEDHLGLEAGGLILDGEVPPTLPFIATALMKLPVLFRDIFAVVESGSEFTSQLGGTQIGEPDLNFA